MILNTQYNIRWTGFFLTFLGAMLFSTKAIIVKKAFHDTHIDALSLLTIRMIFSLPFYIGIALFAGNKKQTIPISKKQLSIVIILGLFGYYISSFLDFEGLQYISAGLERLILFLYPSFAVIINATVFRQQISRIQFMVLLLTYIGIAIAYIGQLHIATGSHDFFFGSVLVLVCAITYAIYIVGSGGLIPQVGATKFTAYAMLAATCGVCIHYAVVGNNQLLHSGTVFWRYGILLAVVATVVPSFLISYGLKRIGSSNVAIISGIGPVSTIVQAHVVLGERIFAAQITGTLLVIAGALLIGWKSKPAIA